MNKDFFALGALLRQAREAKSVNLAHAASALKIKKPYLIAIEHGALDQLPQSAYLSGYIRNYARWLGVDLSEYYHLLHLTSAELNTYEMSAVKERRLLRRLLPSMAPNTRVILASLALTILIYLAWYMLWYFPNYVGGG